METRPKDWGAFTKGRAAIAASVGHELEDDGPLHVVVSEQARTTEAGQLALLSFLGMASRVHRPITLEFPAGGAPLRVSPLHGDASSTLEEAAINLVRAVNPACSVWLDSKPAPGAIAIGFGPVERPCRWYVSVQRAVATVSAVRTADCDWVHPGSRWGGALGACLAANAVFRTAHGLETPNVRLSAWNWAEGSAAELGPDTWFPIAGGSKLMVGAGSVAGAFVHWLHYFGVAGAWSIVDSDEVSESNLIKGLNLAARDVGRAKAQQLASLLPGARWESAWYADSELATEKHDLVLCLANEFDVRSAISSRDPELILHATTGEAWDVHLHRHIRNRDDCLACRTRDWKQARMLCSSASMPTEDGGHADTALPFAAGLAGLMLASALSRLEAGELELGAVNHWALYLASEGTFTQHNKARCWKSCPRHGHAPLLPGRWLRLDPRVAGISPPQAPRSA